MAGDDETLLVFGGTFDPPHRAHVELPPLVAAALGCERIVYVPAAVNPLKQDHAPTASGDRLAMLRLALAGSPAAEISTIELDRPGPSYTVDTLESLRAARGPGAKLFLLMGSDQALQFRRWKDWRRILKLATPAVMVRPPLTDETYRRALGDVYSAKEVERWWRWHVEVPQYDICASGLRRMLAAGQDTAERLAPAVLSYIHEHGLYRTAARRP